MSKRRALASLWSLLALLALCACARADRPAERPPEAAATRPTAEREAAQEPWSDPWILAEGERFREDTPYRRDVLVRSLVRPENTYSRIRLESYALGDRGWDKLPVWNPRSRPVDGELARRLELGEEVEPPRTTLWDGVVPETMTAWVELGRKVFFAYPMRAEVYMEWALTKPAVAAAVGVERASDGSVPGLVVFADVDQEVRVGITCAICHAAVKDGAPLAGAARRTFDYGRLRLAYFADVGRAVPPRTEQRMSHWGPGRADVTEDDDEDPVAIPDLWGLRAQRWLTQAGTVRHDTPVALAIRQETQLIDSNHSMVRPPRALSWALAMYVYSLSPPARPSRPEPAGAALFADHCAGCHANAAHGGRPLAVEEIGTDPALATGRGRGTGSYRVPALLGVADGAPYLHDGSIRSLGELLTPDRLRPDHASGLLGPGAVLGHEAGTRLAPAERAALIRYVETL